MLFFLYPLVTATPYASLCHSAALSLVQYVFDWKHNCCGSTLLCVSHHASLKMEEQAKYGEQGIACRVVKHFSLGY